MIADQGSTRDSSPLRRIFANTAWLLGGKGFGAVCGLAYLVILTRSLGLKDFGHFSLIFGTAQALIAGVGLETWRVVVRYGAEHVHHRDWDKFGRLAALCGLIDAAGAVGACLVAFVVGYGFSDLLDVNPDYTDMTVAFCCAMAWALVSAPTGVVRALHRFDVAVYVEAVVPVGRLLAAFAIWWTGPSVARFLLAWAAIDLVEAALYWRTARRLRPDAVRFSHLRHWRLGLDENPGIRHFLAVTYAGSLTGALMRYGPLLAVGGLVGTSAAGLYRLASQLTQALGKLSTLLTRAVYAEVARVRVTSGASEFRRLTLQTSMMAGLAGAAVIGLALALGARLLGFVGGPGFERGAAVLIPLALAASLELASVAFEPVLHATGRAAGALLARMIGVLILAVGIAALIELRATGIAWAVALASAATYALLGTLTYVTLRREARERSAELPQT